VVQRLGHQVCEGAEEAVGHIVAVGAIDRPPQRVDHHLRISGETAMIRARSPASGMSLGSNITATVLTSGFITAWFQADGNPRRLLRRQQIVGGVGLHLDDAVQRVLDLAHLTRMPPGDQAVGATSARG